MNNPYEIEIDDLPTGRRIPYDGKGLPKVGDKISQQYITGDTVVEVKEIAPNMYVIFVDKSK